MDHQSVTIETGDKQMNAQINEQQTADASHQDVQQLQQQSHHTIPSTQSQPQVDQANSIHDIKSTQHANLLPIDNSIQPAPNVTAVQIPTHQQSSLEQPQVQSYPPPIRPLLEDEPNNGAMPSNNGQNAHPDAVSLSPQKSAITKVTLSDELNVFYWTKTKEIINQIAEEAKSSVVTVLTTLDPGMKEYLYSGGSVNIIVISETECQVSPIRDSFQSAFGRATVNPASYTPPNTIIDHPVRLACGLQEAAIVAQEKIKKLRQDTSGVLPQNQVVVAVQPTLVPFGNTTETNDNSNDLTSSSWFSTYCMLIEDPVLNVTMKCFSQFIPIDSDVAKSAREAKFPENFPGKHLGFAVSLDELMSYKMKLDPISGLGDEYGCFWLRKWAGIYETQLIQQLSSTLAASYRRKWDESARVDTISG